MEIDGVKTYNNKLTQISTSPILPDKIFRSSRYGLAVSLIYLAGGEWISTIVRIDRLGDARSVRSMIGQGVPFALGSHKELLAFVQAWIRDNPEIPEGILAESTGWHEDDYYWGFKVIGSDKSWSSLSSTRRNLFNRQRALGEKSIWISTMAEVLEEAPYLSVGLSATAASLFLRYFGINNFIVDYSSETSTGKTTTLQILASMWGDPSETIGLVHGWMDNDLEDWLDSWADHPIFLDDSTDKPLKDRVSSIFHLGRGVSSEGQSPSVLISNGESPLVTEGMPGGALARVITLTDRWIPFGAPVDLWKVKLMKNYGHMPEVLVDEFKKKSIDEWAHIYRTRIGNWGDGVTWRKNQYWASIECGAMLLESSLPDILLKVRKAREKWTQTM